MSLLADAGLVAQWSKEDREACRAEHAVRFRELKRRRFGKIAVAAAEIPGMISSLNRLFESGYNVTDVAVMFGVSRQRVDQWRKKYDLKNGIRGGSAYRMWDPRLDRFVPVTRTEMVARLRIQRELRRRAGVTERHEAERHRHVRALLRLARACGRPPTLGELAEELGYAGIAQAATRYWKGVNGAETYAEMTTEMYRAAGLRKYRPGEPVDP